MTKDWSKWERTRQRGVVWFVLVVGALGWGISVGLFWSVIMSQIDSSRSFASYVTRALIGFPIGGILWGAFMWRLTERKYAEHKATLEDPHNEG